MEQKTDGPRAAGGNVGGVFITPKNASKQEFVRKTTKYWVHAADIPEMKRIILAAGLPEYTFSKKITNLVQSLYLDNNVLRRYQDRMMLVDKGMLFRYRWYGDAVPKIGFMEQKIRRIGVTTSKSVKRRFKLPLEKVQAYIDGDYSPTRENSTLDPESLAMAEEIQQEWILREGLKPMVRTAYNRTCYQKNFDDPIRISFDENLQLSLIKNNKCFFSNPEDLMKTLQPDEVYNFPHGVLEIKVRLTGARSNYLPPWAQDMVLSFCDALFTLAPLSHARPSPAPLHDFLKTLHRTIICASVLVQMDRGIIVPSDKFSKFNAATAILLNDQVNKIPYFLPLMEQFTPAPSDVHSIPFQLNASKNSPRLIWQIERTFLGWLRMCQMMAFLGFTVLLTDLSAVSTIGAALLVFGSLFVLIRVTYLFYYRSHISKVGLHDYYDSLTPMWFVIFYLVGITIQSYSVSEGFFFNLFDPATNAPTSAP